MSGLTRISPGHASEDKPEVRELYWQLKARGFEPRLDAAAPMPCENWRVEISNAIKQAGAFLLKLLVPKQGYVLRGLRYWLLKYAELSP